jgi:hypothetical protein
MSGDDDSSVAVSEVGEEVDAEIVYDSDFERMSSASSRSGTDHRRHDMHAVGHDDSPTTTALKVEFLAGITSMEEMHVDGEIMDVGIESDEICDDALGWSQSLDVSAEMIATPRRGDNLHLTTLSTRSYSGEEEADFVDFAQDDTIRPDLEPEPEPEPEAEPEPDAFATNSFALPSGQAVSVCADIFLQLQPDTKLRMGNLTFVGDA